MSLTNVDWLEIDLSGSADSFPYLENSLIRLGYPGWVDLCQIPSTAEEIDREMKLPEELRRPLVAADVVPTYCYRVYLPKEGDWQKRLIELQEEALQLGLQCSLGSEVRDEDWAENWKEFYRPLPIGDRLLILPSWLEPPAGNQREIILLDPGSAFGTGYHPTTQLCLELLEQSLIGDVSGLQMLDVGTGSGILSVGAWKLGIRKLLASDCDAVAVKVAGENLKANGIPVAGVEQVSDPLVPLVFQVQGAGLGVPADLTPVGGFDLIVANIVAQTLIELCAHLKAALAPGGQLILGGIIDHRLADLEAAFAAGGLQLKLRCERDGWYALAMTHA